MILIEYSRKQAADIVEQHLVGHKSFLLSLGDLLILAGRKNPPTGGWALVNSTDLEKIKSLFSQDPFIVHDVAEIKYHQITPSMGMLSKLTRA